MARDYMENSFLKHTVLFKEGEAGDFAYVLQKGRVELSKRIGDEARVVAVLHPVSLFGEMALILPDHKRTATARALDDVHLIQVDRREFERMVSDSPSLLRAAIHTLVARLKTSTTMAAHAPNRIRAMARILELLAWHDARDMDLEQVHLAMRKIFHLRRAEAEGLLKWFHNQGLVEVSPDRNTGGTVTVPEPKNLEERALEALREGPVEL